MLEVSDSEVASALWPPSLYFHGWCLGGFRGASGWVPTHPELLARWPGFQALSWEVSEAPPRMVLYFCPWPAKHPKEQASGSVLGYQAAWWTGRP